jgi:hypothetical protein
LERHACGGEIPNTANLGPKHPRPRATEWRGAATRSNADGGEEPDHNRESFGEACARRGGLKTRRSTAQEAHEPNSHTTAQRQPQKRWHRQGSKQAGEVTSGARVRWINPTTKIYTQQKKTPKLKDP